MRAAFIERHGGNEVVQVGTQPVPSLRPDQVLIRVHASCVNPRDWLLRDGRYVFRHFVRGFPIILGSDVSGVIAATGPLVRDLHVGDAVVAMQTTLGQMGAYAQYMAVAARAVGRKPLLADHEHASGLGVAGLTALQALRDDGRLRPGERVAILGASGGVGHYAVQIAKYLGAGRVVGVCSAANEAFVRELGADATLDYRSGDVVAALADAGGVDLVFDAIGKGDLRRHRPCLRPGGRYVTTVPTAKNTEDQLRSLVGRALGRDAPVARTVLVRPTRRDLEQLAAMMDMGELRTVVDSVHELDAVTDALARSRTQRARGKIIIRIPT